MLSDVHAALGWLLGGALYGSGSTGQYALASVALLPDLDYLVLIAASPWRRHLDIGRFHRTWSHSLLVHVAFSVLVALYVGRAHAGVAALATLVLAHLLPDVVNDFPVNVAWPRAGTVSASLWASTDATAALVVHSNAYAVYALGVPPARALARVCVAWTLYALWRAAGRSVALRRAGAASAGPAWVSACAWDAAAWCVRPLPTCDGARGARVRTGRAALLGGAISAACAVSPFMSIAQLAFVLVCLMGPHIVGARAATGRWPSLRAPAWAVVRASPDVYTHALAVAPRDGVRLAVEDFGPGVVVAACAYWAAAGGPSALALVVQPIVCELVGVIGVYKATF